MTITFESDNDVIIYAFEMIISYNRENQYIFLVQSVWWISSVIGLQQGLIVYIDNLKERENIGRTTIQSNSPAVPDLLVSQNKAIGHTSKDDTHIHPERVNRIQYSDNQYTDSQVEVFSTSEEDIHNEVIENYELFLEQSKQERKAIGRRNRQASRIVKRNDKKSAKKIFGIQTRGVNGFELR